jgi:TolB-like protein/tetratricopeptide (TPR) repeat protein
MLIFRELKRRNVFRVGAAYIVVAWLLIQVAETIFPLFGFDETPARIVVILLAIGFVPALIISWVFELTPEGLRKDKDVDRTAPIDLGKAKKLDRAIMILLALAVGYFAFDKFVLSESREAVIAEEARQEGRSEALVRSYGDKSIAVLAFDDMSPTNDQEYLSDGIAEEVLNLLAQVPDLRVISRSSAFSFKGRNVEIPEVGRRLNVAHVLEGSVRKSGNRLRITAQLIDARSDTHLWSETYDRVLDDVFAVQDEIAATVAERLKTTLLGKVPKSSPVNPAAYEIMLESRYVSRSGTPEGFLKSNELADKALEIEPAYADPWVIKAKNYSNMAEAGVLPREESYELAREAAEQALAIAPEQAGPHSVTAWVALHYLNDMVLAARHFERANELAPADPAILSNAAAFLLRLRRFDKAIAVYEFVAQRNPLNPIAHFNRGQAYFAARRFSDSAAAFQSALDLSPEFRGGHLWFSKALLLGGDAAAACEAATKESFEPFRILARSLCTFELGEMEEADASLTWMMEKGESKFPYDIASVWAYRGDGERLSEWIMKSINFKDNDIGDPVMDPLFDVALEDPLWKNLMQALGKSPAQLDSIQFDVVVPEDNPT